MTSTTNSFIDRKRQCREFWLFMLIALIVIGAGIGLRDPWPADEPRFTLIAQQMVESGDWLIPHRGNELYPDKPPLFMATQALAYELVGNWRIAFLLPSLLAALGTLALVYDLGTRLWNRRVGLLAAWFVLFGVGFTFQAKRAQIDPTVTFLIVLAVYGFIRHLLRGPDWRWWAIGGLATGLGIVAKGVGIVAFLVLLPWAWLQFRGQRTPANAIGSTKKQHRHWLWLLAPGMCVLIVAAWLVPVLLVVHSHASPEYDTYLQDLLFKQTAQRYAASWHHVQPAWYYLEVIALQWIPLSLFLPWLIPAWWQRLRRGDPRYLMLLGFVVLVVLFFSLSSGKREVYILPALPFLALAAAPLVPPILARQRWLGKVLWGICALFALVVLLTVGYLWLVAPDVGIRLLEGQDFRGSATSIWIWLAVVGVVTAFACSIAGPSRPLMAGTITLAAFWFCIGVGIMPILNDASSARGMMRVVGETIGPDAELGLVGWREQQLLQADRPARTFGFSMPLGEQLAAALSWQSGSSNRWLLVLAQALTNCPARPDAIDLGMGNRREWVLLPARKDWHCPLPAQPDR